ncbi:MAG TPA: bacterial proteasome activator family protein [Ilumatobacteraceae bacterium]|nr:bacterial proteasome activator family protein [Ilumatobacteraceae bacterium]
MSETDANASPEHDTARPDVERGELVEREVLNPAEVEVVDSTVDSVDESTESVTEPGKVMRIGSMVKQLLEEVRLAPLDEASRERLAEIYERSIVEVSGALSPDLQEELHSLALPFRPDVVPSEAEIRVAKAQLVGWLEGLFHGIQATLFAQQIAARQQFEQLRQLPGATGGPAQRPGQGDRPGTYL